MENETLQSFYWEDIRTGKIHQIVDCSDNFDMAETTFSYFEISSGKTLVRIEDYKEYIHQRFGK